MNGKEYYRFTKRNVAFYSLNSNYMDKKQLQWLESELAKDTSEWKICFFHHPPYSSGGKHGSDKPLREVIEPIFVKYGVNVCLMATIISMSALSRKREFTISYQAPVAN